MEVGVNDADGGISFRTWAPNATAVALIGDFNNWQMWSTMLANEGDGNWSIDLPWASVGDEYRYVFINNGTQYSRLDARSYQVTNSTGNSVVYDPQQLFLANGRFRTACHWNESIIYEMHVGTFAGGFLQAIKQT